MFTPQDRERVHQRLLEWARDDPRVISAAIVGSMAHGSGDRWSDIDLTFGVQDGTSVRETIDEWSGRVAKEFGGTSLFDLVVGPTTYRVFLLPGCLQVDLSFSPASQFGAIGPNFRLLFGTAVERTFVEPQSAREVFGYAVHHVVRARACIERGRFWQAEYWISAARDHALALACRRRGLPGHYAKGADDLPTDVRGAYAGTFPRTLDGPELLRALRQTVERLLDEGDDELAATVGPWLRI